MLRIGIVLIGLVLWSCNSRKSEETGFSYEKFSELFPSEQLSYQLTDADLLSNKDTTSIRSAEFEAFISDSVKKKLFGKTTNVKYIALARVKAPKNTSYYIIKAINGNKRVALLVPFTNNQFDAAFPFLIPDNDATTKQTSTIDKSNAIIKGVSQQKPGGKVAEGREVYQYVPEAKQFTLLLTNPLNNTAEVINPIDTLSRKHKYSGDYLKDKENFISIRDGRSSNELLLFIHIEKGDCTGEIKATLLLASSTTGVYRQSGDPCELSFQFKGNSVVVKEGGGCGSRRGLDCSFNGTYTKKKEAKTKTTKKRASSK
ncbi:MAG: hypothetical protein J7502_18110 [Flavisolibacter sp.]|nr:hypothetical protein [Flavisolibacter sp.]